MTRIEEKEWPQGYLEILENPPSSVTLETVMILFIILLTGIVTSVLVLSFEFGLQKLGQLFQRLNL
jgi:hypothetical protein